MRATSCAVHACDGNDCYFADYFRGKDKAYAYRSYLEAVRKSLDAPYGYDIVGHIGYVSRNAPYPDKTLRYEIIVIEVFGHAVVRKPLRLCREDHLFERGDPVVGISGMGVNVGEFHALIIAYRQRFRKL